MVTAKLAIEGYKVILNYQFHAKLNSALVFITHERSRRSEQERVEFVWNRNAEPDEVVECQNDFAGHKRH